MKRAVIIVSIVIVAISAFAFYKIQADQKLQDLKNEQAEYNYLEKTITGSELATLMNKAINKNYKNGVEQGEEKAIEIEIKFLDSDKIFKMEALNKAGLQKFVELYSTQNFKCTSQKADNKGIINSLFFEELQNIQNQN